MAGGCGRCGVASPIKYVWTSNDGETVIEYESERAAQAKVLRRGGAYVTVRR